MMVNKPADIPDVQNVQFYIFVTAQLPSTQMYFFISSADFSVIMN